MSAPVSADEPGTVCYALKKGSVRQVIESSHYVFADEWDERRCTIRHPTSERHHRIVNGIASDVRQIQSIIDMFTYGNKSVSVARVVKEYLRLRSVAMLFDYMSRIIDRMSERGQCGTAANYTSALSSLRQYRRDIDLPLTDITTFLLEDYQSYLRHRNVMINTMTFYLHILRAVYNRAVRERLIIDIHPFDAVSMSVEHTRKRALRLEDMKNLQKIVFRRRPALTFAKDIFLLLFYCRGMSFVDAAYLRKSDVRDGFIIYRRRKTNQLIKVKIVSEIATILSRYTPATSPYLLPIIHSEETARSDYRCGLQRVNRALHHIGQRLALNIPLTTYVSRHTWATLARDREIPLPVISEALGHTSIRTTQIYLAEVDADVVDRANSMIISLL